MKMSTREFVFKLFIFPQDLLSEDEVKRQKQVSEKNK